MHPTITPSSRLAALFCLLIPVFFTTQAQEMSHYEWTTLSAELEEKINMAILEVHDLQENTGLSVAVIRDGKLVYSKTFGWADVDNKIPVGRHTQFPVASITKAFTGTALIQMAKAGKLDLNAKVSQYLEVPDDKKDIRLFQLASHTAGIRHYKEGEKTPEFLSRHYETAQEAMSIFIHDELLFQPGTDYQYTSFGYNLLAAVIEQQADMTFTEYVEKKVFKPMGLKHTAFDNVKKSFPQRTKNYAFFTPYQYQPKEELQTMPVFDYSYNNGGGNILTTAEDLAKFGVYFTRPDFFTKEQLAYFQEKILDSDRSPWSYGWFVSRSEEGVLQLNMTGAFAGTQAGIYIYPESQTVVVVLSNCWGKGSNSGDLVMAVPRHIVALLDEN
jgi:serine beta-lactamase-like protein LACTB